MKRGNKKRIRLLEQSRYRPPIANSHRPAFAIVDFRIGSDTQGVVNRRQHVFGADWVLGRVRPDAVAPAIRLPTANAAAGENSSRAGAPVLAALLRVDPRSPA